MMHQLLPAFSIKLARLLQEKNLNSNKNLSESSTAYSIELFSSLMTSKLERLHTESLQARQGPAKVKHLMVSLLTKFCHD